MLQALALLRCACSDKAGVKSSDSSPSGFTRTGKPVDIKTWGGMTSDGFAVALIADRMHAKEGKDYHNMYNQTTQQRTQTVAAETRR